MLVDLTFTNLGTTHVSEHRAVYLGIDDDAGRNYLRRNLPSVDFRLLAPGKPVTFSVQLLSGAFPAGHYTIYLWIPNPDPSLQFNPRYNFLLGSVGVPNPSTGLNVVASFTVNP